MRRLGLTLSIGLVIVYVAAFVFALPVFQPWGPFSTFDEYLQYYQAGRNFADRGFISTALLPDLATGASAVQHPYVYNHQPPGPQLLIGVVFRIFGEQYALVRLIFAGAATLGIVAYFALLRSLEARGIAGATLSFLVVGPIAVMHSIDHPAYSLFPLFAFLPILLLQRYHASGDERWRLLAALFVFVAVNYLLYGVTIMVFAFWLCGSLAGALPVSRRDLVIFMSVAVIGVGLHLLQTVALVGPVVFLQELVYTVSNRIVGRPTREELEVFYASNGFVLYGGHSLAPRRILAALGESVRFPAWPMVVAAVAVIGIARLRATKCPLPVAQVASLAGWTLVPALLPVAVFPAFASDYGLHGTNEFFVGIFAVALVGLALRLVEDFPTDSVARKYLRLLLITSVAVGMATQAFALARVVRHTVRWTATHPLESGLVWVREQLGGRIVMTNIDPIAIGFLTREIALGGCNRPTPASAIPDPRRCAIRFVRGWPNGLPGPVTEYVWVGVGNRFCQGSQCISRADLNDQSSVLFANAVVAVYDLSSPKDVGR